MRFAQNRHSRGILSGNLSLKQLDLRSPFLRRAQDERADTVRPSFDELRMNGLSRRVAQYKRLFEPQLNNYHWFILSECFHHGQYHNKQSHVL